MPPSVVFMTQGRLFLQRGDAKPRELESAFVEQALERAQRQRQRHGWREDNMLWGGMNQGRGVLPNMPSPDNTRPVQFTAVAPSPGGDGLVYALTLERTGGLFHFKFGEDYERRLIHRQELHVTDLASHPSLGLVACSMGNSDGSASLAVMDNLDSRPQQITEGDSVDQAPAWAPGSDRVLVYQSAGIARDAGGFATMLGPYRIEKLDLERHKLTTLLEDASFDFLLPRVDGSGGLHFIRRPWQGAGHQTTPWTVLRDIFLFPVRLFKAVLGFLNVFSQMFSGEPLTSAGGPKVQGPDARQLFLWGRMFDLQKSRSQPLWKREQALVPADWELVRQGPDGQLRVLAKSVLSYDLDGQGGVVYSNGGQIRHLDQAGHEEILCKDHLAERVIVVP